MNEQAGDIREDGPIAGFFTVTCAVGLAAAVLFVGFPGIDFWVTDFFAFGDQAFLFNWTEPAKDLRVLFKIMFWIAGISAFVGLVFAVYHRRRFLTFGFPQWFFLLSCLIIGPGLVANVLLKDTWGRARPFHVQEYGGKQTFTPALMRSDACENNCSFVSGEAASIYTIFFALALIARRRRLRILAIGVGAGTVSGFIRIGQGGHFLSDVVFAGVFMALVVRVLYWLMFERGAEAFDEQGPVHEAIANSPTTAKVMSVRAAKQLQHHTQSSLVPAARKGVEALSGARMLPEAAGRLTQKVREKVKGRDERPKLVRPDLYDPD